MRRAASTRSSPRPNDQEKRLAPEHLVTALKCALLTTFGLIALPGALRAASADPVAGAVVFQRCAACHSIDPSGRNGLGPNLRGVVGRGSGKAPGFAYS